MFKLKRLWLPFAAAVATTCVLIPTSLASSGAPLLVDRSNTGSGTTGLVGGFTGNLLSVANSGLGGSVGVAGGHTASSGAGPGVLGVTSSASAGASGVFGYERSPTAGPGSAGVIGRTDSTAGGAEPLGGAFGVYGLVSSTSPGTNSAGVRGINNSTTGSGIGVWGSQNGSGWGVYGISSSGVGVRAKSVSGNALEASTPAANQSAIFAHHDGSASGVAVDASTVKGKAVYGYTADGTAITGESQMTGPGLWGIAHGAGSGANNQVAAIIGQEVGTLGTGVEGSTLNACLPGANADTETDGGVIGIANNQGTAGVLGGCHEGAIGTASAANSFGVLAEGSGSAISALKAQALNNGNAIEANASGNGTAGVFTAGGTGFAVYGSGKNAAQFIGSVDITGHLTVSSCTGCTTAARDVNATSSVQGGTVVTDAHGFAVVRVPALFQSQYHGFRYQLTAMGHNAWGAPLVVWNELRNDRFTIRSRSHVKVSWQVTGTQRR